MTNNTAGEQGEKIKVDGFEGTSRDGRKVLVARGPVIGSDEDGYYITIDHPNGRSRIAMTPDTFDSVIALKKRCDMRKAVNYFMWRIVMKIVPDKTV